MEFKSAMMGGVSGDLPDHQGDQQHPLFLWVQEAPENKREVVRIMRKIVRVKFVRVKQNWIEFFPYSWVQFEVLLVPLTRHNKVNEHPCLIIITSATNHFVTFGHTTLTIQLELKAYANWEQKAVILSLYLASNMTNRKCFLVFQNSETEFEYLHTTARDRIYSPVVP